MSQRSRLVEINRRNLAGHRSGEIQRVDDVLEVPVTNYTDPSRWQAEVDRIFKRIPLVAGFSDEISEKSTYKAIDMVGMPVLLSRDRTGEVRAFVNTCSHRGAIIMPPGTGKARSFSCPYHAWTYNSQGDLVAILDEEDFGEVDSTCLGLTSLPVLERAGLIWVILSPEPVIDFDTYFQSYDEVLGYLELDECHHVGSQRIDGPNWKICYDGYLDLYHLPVLHKESFGDAFSNRANYDAWGPHQQVSTPSLDLEDLEESPPEKWPTDRLASGLSTLFPHVSIARRAAGDGSIMVSQLFPGSEVGSSYTIQNFLVRGELTDERVESAQQSMDFLRKVVADEDYRTCERIQRTLLTGAKPNVLFGRNEGGGQTFHRWVDAVVETDDSALAELFETGPADWSA
ncbi:MAG: aromatic ring-hydroxylating oxygenase subunit alpha [Acidimicrobiales bacterium]